MFKIETVVRLTLAFSLAQVNLATAYAQTTSNTTNVGSNCSDLFRLGFEAGKTDKDRADYFYKQAENCLLNQSKNGDDCNNAPADYRTAQGELNKACGLANLGGECDKELAKCLDRNKEDSGGGDRTRRSSRRDANQPYDPDSVKKMCPAMAGKDLERLEKELKDQKDKVQKLEKEIPDLEDKANKVMSSTNEKLQKNKQDQAEEQTKLSDALQKLSDERDGAEKAIMDQITNITAQIAKANDAMSQLSVTKMEGQLKLKQTKTQAELNCHASASAQVAKMQTDVLTATAAGTYNRSGFASMLKNVGMTDRQSWQRTATKYYKWCLDSKPTMDTKEGANDGYRLLVAQSDKSEASIREQIRQLQAQQRQLTSPGGCGQAIGALGGETAQCQSVRKGAEKANQAQQAYATKVQTLKENYAETQNQGTREYQSLERQAMTKKQEIGDERKRLDNLQQYLQAKYDRSGGNSQVDGKGLSEALGRLVAAETAAENLIACKKKLNPGASKSRYCTGQCDAANAFLGRIGVDNYEPELDTSEPAAVANGGSILPAGQTPDAKTRIPATDKSNGQGIKETPGADGD